MIPPDGGRGHAHHDRARVPAACDQAAEHRRLGGFGVRVKRLGIVLLGERNDLRFGEHMAAERVRLACLDVFEIFHRRLYRSDPDVSIVTLHNGRRSRVNLTCRRGWPTKSRAEPSDLDHHVGRTECLTTNAYSTPSRTPSARSR